MKTDIVIVGGGPNGLAAALALGSSRLRAPLRVHVVDGRDPKAFSLAGHDTRGFAMTVATQAMLRQLGVWQKLEEDAQEMRDIMVTDDVGDNGPRLRLLNFHTPPEEKAAAAIVETRHIAAALMAAVEQSPSIEIMPNMVVEQLSTGPGLAKLTCKDGTVITAPLVVAADGRHSSLRKLLGIATKGHSYGQTAVSFTIAHSLAHDGLAEEHFSPDGVFAVLPLKGNRSSIVWGMTPEAASHRLGMPEEEFMAELSRVMGPRLGTISLEGTRAGYPLIMQVADAFTAPRTVLIGDAAHALHPLAGLGLNLGYKDVAALADVVADAAGRGEDIGSAAVLSRYESWRRFDTMATAAVMEGMNGLFVNDNPVLRELRGLGLGVVERMPQAKRFFMQAAAGQSHQFAAVPRLMQGLLPG